jgi:hypothetical protein
VKRMFDAMERGKVTQARAGLNEAMYLLRKSRGLPGDSSRRARMTRVVAWLAHEQRRQ